MKFSIITPTYKRAEKLLRAVESLQNQTYADWEMIIVNDSPHDTSYNDFSSSINDARIHYHINPRNMGVNYSRNYAISKISADSKWVIFLDDDDYFAPDALQTFYTLLLLHSDKKWFVTNRALKNGAPLTRFPKDETTYSYAWKYLLLKICKGDATHCIETKLLIQNSIHFSQHIKQGEEWFFFYQVGLHQKMYYSSHNSTISDGYDAKEGLNFRKRTKEERFDSVSKLTHEGTQLHLIYYLTFNIYIFIRYVQIIFK